MPETRPADLRTFIEGLRRERPDDILELEGIDLRYQLSALQWKLETQGLFPFIIVHNAITAQGERSKFPVVTNMFASRARCAWALGSTPERVSFTYAEKVRKRLEPEVIPNEKAPCQEVVKQGKDVNLLELPAPIHHEWDPAPYLTAGFCTMKWPDLEAYNDGLHRAMIRDRYTMATFLSFAKHNWYILEENNRRKVPTPVVFWLGHHAGVYFGAQARAASYHDEYTLPGAFTGTPFRLTPSVTWGEKFLVPADAEFVIEGEILPGEEVPEGPFGEYTRYYGEQRYSPLIHVKAITHRKDAIFQDILVSHADNHVMGGFPLEGRVYESVRANVASVRNVHLPLSGCCRFLCYVQISKQTEGEGKLAAALALPTDSRIKYVVVVDDDVDIFNEAEVLWAVATRTKFPDDAIIITDVIGEGLDPMGTDTGLVTKVGIDATRPIATAFAEKVSFPREVLAELHLDRLVPRHILERLPRS
ncbi:MAG TPA: UbiD family decarboxylase [Chloroflexota bacterium]|nr:UbiD family decarboxylase [Chloroflexota bacterium]